MSDVFLSYVLTDRVFVEQLVAGLEEQGFTAFSDARRIHACILDKGTVVEAERSKVVAVVWSTSSVKSPWVQSEALIGLNRDKLLSISIDDAATPKPFSGTHAVSIKDRSSDADGIAHVIKAMKAQLKGEAWVSTPTPSKSAPSKPASSKPASPESKAPASELQTKASSKTADVAKPKPKGRVGLLLEIVKTSMAAGGFAMVNYAGYEWLRDSTGALDFIVVLGASIALTLVTGALYARASQIQSGQVDVLWTPFRVGLAALFYVASIAASFVFSTGGIEAGLIAGVVGLFGFNLAAAAVAVARVRG